MKEGIEERRGGEGGERGRDERAGHRRLANNVSPTTPRERTPHLIAFTISFFASAFSSASLTSSSNGIAASASSFSVMAYVVRSTGRKLEGSKSVKVSLTTKI